MAVKWRIRQEGIRRLAALGGLALLACVSSSSSPTEPEAESPGITVVVDGETRDFSSPTVRLCSEGLPEELRVEVTAAGPDCPEQFVQGPADSPLSRGRICDELLVQARGFELGVPMPAGGSSRALVAYSRFEAPALSLSTGDGGPGSTTGSITIEEFGERPGEEYRLGFSVSLTGEAEVSASANLSVAPAPCTSASPSPLSH